MLARSLAIVALAVALCAVCSCSSGPATVTAHGREVLLVNPQYNDEIWSTYPGIGNGTPVTVTDSSGKVVGTGKLRLDWPATRRDESAFARSACYVDEMPTDVVAVYDFRVTVPAGLARYDLTIGSGHGSTWFSAAQMAQGPAVTLGSLDGPDPQSNPPRALIMGPGSSACLTS